jgi:uncharacterized protein
MNSKHIVIAGGSGFIGRALAKEFFSRGFSVTVLTRSPRARNDGTQEVFWDGKTAGDWHLTLDGAQAVVNLAGKTINCPHTARNLAEIAASRVNSVNAIADAVKRIKMPPRVWVQASAVGVYGGTGDRICDETAPAGDDALSGICRKWEGAGALVNLPQMRKVVLRIGFVLGRDGGALPVLRKMTNWFLGGAAGNGRQFISWIHLADLARMFAAAVEDDKLSGVYNAVGPNPATNAEFMRTLRHTLHRPWSPPAPPFAVKLGARLIGSEGSLALVGQRCVPKRFLETGFQFEFADLAPALELACS